jgi:hypothetical protein
MFWVLQFTMSKKHVVGGEVSRHKIIKKPNLKGLRIHGGFAHPDVRCAVLRFAAWLRKEVDFPVRVNVYLSLHPFLITRNGEKCFALIWIPDGDSKFPYIRIATGDYKQLRKKRGRDNALASYLCSLGHELIHYQQWVETDEIWEQGGGTACITFS